MHHSCASVLVLERSATAALLLPYYHLSDQALKDIQTEEVICNYPEYDFQGKDVALDRAMCPQKLLRAGPPAKDIEIECIS